MFRKIGIGFAKAIALAITLPLVTMIVNSTWGIDAAVQASKYLAILGLVFSVVKVPNLGRVMGIWIALVSGLSWLYYSETQLQNLRTQNPEAYLAEIKWNDKRWLDELQILKPGEYAVEMKRREVAKAAEEAQKLAEAKAKAKEEQRSIEKQEAAAEEARKVRQAGHCQSAWNGSLVTLINAVKSRLRDPDSFEHVNTFIEDVDAQGANEVLMQYRAKNGFGGLNDGMVAAKINNRDCSVIELKM